MALTLTMEQINLILQQIQEHNSMSEQLLGSANMAYQYQNASKPVSYGHPIGNNSCSPCTTQMESSAVSKPKTLILNERAKRNTTTLETKAGVQQPTGLGACWS